MADVRPVTDDEKTLVASELTAAERTELIAVSAQYLGVAATCQVLEIPSEPGAPRMPRRG